MSSAILLHEYFFAMSVRPFTPMFNLDSAGNEVAFEIAEAKASISVVTHQPQSYFTKFPKEYLSLL